MSLLAALIARCAGSIFSTGNPANSLTYSNQPMTYSNQAITYG